VIRFVPVVVGAAVVAGCTLRAPVDGPGPDAASARYALGDRIVELDDGRFDSPPERVVLAARHEADIDGDGDAEAIVVLERETGGSGRFFYLAVVDDAEAVAPTHLLGDRVEIMALATIADVIEVVLVRAGESDPLCCPGEKSALRFTWQADDGLAAVHEAALGRLSIADLDGRWHWLAINGAPVIAGVYLNVDAGRIEGRAPCNRYFGTLTEGTLAGELTIGALGGTRRACEPNVMALEARFLNVLGRVSQFRLAPSRLELSGDGERLTFEPADQASVE